MILLSSSFLVYMMYLFLNLGTLQKLAPGKKVVRRDQRRSARFVATSHRPQETKGVCENPNEQGPAVEGSVQHRSCQQREEGNHPRTSLSAVQEDSRDWEDAKQDRRGIGGRDFANHQEDENRAPQFVLGSRRNTLFNLIFVLTLFLSKLLQSEM